MLAEETEKHLSRETLLRLMSPAQESPSVTPGATHRPWCRLWFALAGIAAIASTSVDAILLQAKHSLFTGGFLIPDHLKGPMDVMAFVAASLVADAGVTFPMVAFALWVCTAARLNAKPSALTVVVVSVAPLMLTDFLWYEIHRYLGDAFSFLLSYEVAARSPAELIATALPHLIAPLFLLLGTSGLIVFSVWFFKRYLAGKWTALPQPPSLRRLGLQVGAVTVLALLLTCATQFRDDAVATGIRLKPSGQFFCSLGDYISDLDRDGYGIVKRPFDPAPLDPHVFPYAVEIPGNGIDENNVGGDLPKEWPPYREGPSRVAEWKYRPNVILVVLESFRADLIDATYQGKPITPVLNQLKHDGVSAELAFSHNGYTVPSRYNIFSGSLAHSRGSTTLIDDFKTNGYQVASFSAEDANFGEKEFDFGFARADVHYDAQVEPNLRYSLFATPGSIALPYNIIVDRFSAFLEHRRDDRPLFVHLNFQDTHFPYHHSGIRPLINSAALSRTAIGPDRAADLWATYANAAANVDMAIGQVLAAAKRFLGDPAPGIIVTSDHAEALYDDGFLGHGQWIDDLQTRVPLVVANLPMVIEQPFGHAELRDAIWHALESAPQAVVLPVLRENAQKTVFQHLGPIERPQQIAFRRLTGRLTYDFRTNLVQLPNAEWTRPDDLTEDGSQAFRRLVHSWEAMIVSMHAADAQRGVLNGSSTGN
jgi:hypothetical protein